jgi:hypothetical protein
VTETIVWAVLTAFITGGVAGGIVVGSVLRKRQRQLSEFQQELVADTNQRLAELDQAYDRLAGVEGRLEFAERLLKRGATAEPES